MSDISTQPVLNESLGFQEDKETKADFIDEKINFWPSMGRYAIAGGAAFFLLGFLEWIDLNIRFAYGFESVADRIIFAAYYSINIFVGLIIGALTGLFVYAASLLIKWPTEIISRGRRPRLIHKLAAWMGIAAFTAILLNQQPRIHLYIKGLIRELEKFDLLRNTLLNHERATSYLILMGLVIGCSIIWAMARWSGSMNRTLRASWLAALLIGISAAYYIDSRIELHLYEYSLHRSMYLLAVTLTMGFVATVYFMRRGEESQSIFKRPGAKTALISAAIIFIASLAFTFIHFGKDQNLSTQVFYRSAHAKQNYKLARWVLDFDRDGYSSVLGGGDWDDGNGSINPGETERVGDGIDNNCIGGDLTDKDLEDWRSAHNAYRMAADPSARRFNVVFIFVDTVRADHLSVYGYHRKTSPNIDKLAARSSVFENALSPSPRTSEAVPKFMQSSYWDAHLESWTQVFTRNGYNTMLFPGRRSWERYKDWMPAVKRAQGKRLPENIDVTIEVLSQAPQDKPFCAFVYVPDPHRPYIKHDEFYFGPATTDLYDGEIAYTDSHLGRLFDWMESAGRLDDTIIVIMSDHGESLGERGIYRHSTQLYNDQIHVPMIVYVPNIPPRRIPDYVSTIDLGSTILSAAGLEYPMDYIGVNLLPLMRGEPFNRPPVYGEQTSQEISKYVRLDQQVHPETKLYMVIAQDGYKLIYNRDFYGFEMFDLKRDPAERRNLYDLMPEKAEEMRRLLGRFVDIVVVSRPWDADEGRYSRTGGIDGDKVEE